MTRRRDTDVDVYDRAYLDVEVLARGPRPSTRKDLPVLSVVTRRTEEELAAARRGAAAYALRCDQPEAVLAELLDALGLREGVVT